MTQQTTAEDKYTIVAELSGGVYVMLPTYKGHENWLYEVFRNVLGYREYAINQHPNKIGVIPEDAWAFVEDFCATVEQLDAALAEWLAKKPLKTEFEFIEFIELEPYKKIKTKIFECRNRKSGVVLGDVKWYGAWRQYCFMPTGAIDCVFSRGCLEDIASFIEQLMQLRKAKS